MNAIKLPVRAYKQSNYSNAWAIRDGLNTRLANDVTELQAQQIVTALNLHDELVAALEFYGRLPTQCRNRIEPGQPGNKNDWLADVGLDEGLIARTVLAKIESVNETKPTKP